MRVYLLLRDDWPEGDTLLGVFSSPEKARKEKIKRVEKYNVSKYLLDQIRIEEWEVDGDYLNQAWPEGEIVLGD